MEIQKQDRVERRALSVGAIGNLSMAGIAWVTYWFSNSEAILLDGNYSFIIFVGMGVALAVSRIKSRRTETFPLGQFFYEALYSFVKGLMILGVILMAVVTSVVRIIFYVGGNTENIPMLNPDPILYYAVTVAVICFLLSGFYRLSNAQIGGQSSLLKTDSKASFVDGMLSLGIAVGVLALRNTDPSGSAGFVPFLADSIITLVLAAMLIGKPVEIIRESIIELALGKLQDEKQYNEYDLIVREECAPQFAVDRLYMSKTGSRYLAVALVRPADGSSQVSLEALHARKQAILERLRPSVPHLMLELVPRS
ncbi:MAG: cation transporter [Spirochaetes bacterium]|jgi:cation diffusion facilitator family transporter|nr:cation transporter [Spirochaetota bacterium]